jgi:N-carbamoyl-L-amino-acid hydrolase
MTADQEAAGDLLAAFAALAAIGRHGGGWTRLAWTDEDRAARAWFTAQAAARHLACERDANGNLWAWWGDRGAGDALVVGSHLDTVPSGGAYDGALGVAAGFAAISALARGGARPRRPVAVAAFADEEGGRFGLATFGSRLLTGALDPAAALARRDADGVALADALAADGLDPDRLGPDPERLAGLGQAVELHVEQGRALAAIPAPLGVATGIWPHGRWRLDAAGRADHAGTTRLADRADPMLVLATAVGAAREEAGRLGAVATVGRLEVHPNATNAIPGRVTAWLDARAARQGDLDDLVAAWRGEVEAAGAGHGVRVSVTAESATPPVSFDPGLRACLAGLLGRLGLPAPQLPTAAGHDAGALAAALPAGMLFVRNPTGASHTPAEGADDADCGLGVTALAATIEELACR